MDPEQREELVRKIMAGEGWTREQAEAAVDRHVSMLDAQAAVEAQRAQETQSFRDLVRSRQTPEGTRRAMELGLGSIAQGVGGTLGLAYDIPAFLYNQTAGRAGAPRAPYINTALRDALPQPETTGEKIASAALEGAAGAVTPGGVLRMTGRTGRGLLRGAESMLGTQAAAGGLGAAANVGVTEATNNPYAGMLAGLLAGAGASVVGGRVTNARELRRTGAVDDARVRPDMQDAASAYYGARDRGVDLRVGDVLPDSRVARLEDALDRSSDAMRSRNTRQLEQVTSMVDDVSETLRPPGLPRDQSVGGWIAQKLRDSYQQAKTEIGAMFDEAERLAAGSTVPNDAFRQTLKDLADEGVGIPDLIPARSTLRSRVQALTSPGVSPSYQSMRGVQTQIGKLTASTTDDAVRGAYQRLYRAISQDMDNWAEGAGQAGALHREAVQRWRERVVPFSSDRRIQRVVSKSGVPVRSNLDDLETSVDLASDFKITGGPEQVDLVMTLLPPEARSAVPYRSWAEAARRADPSDAGLRAATFLRQTDLGAADDPTSFRRMMENAGELGTAQDVRDVVNRSRRAMANTGPLPQTGVTNFGRLGRLGAAAAGAGGGYAAGGPIGGVLGAAGAGLLQPFVQNTLARGVSSPVTASLLFARGAYPFAAGVQGLLNRGNQ